MKLMVTSLIPFKESVYCIVREFTNSFFAGRSICAQKKQKLWELPLRTDTHTQRQLLVAAREIPPRSCPLPAPPAARPARRRAASSLCCCCSHTLFTPCLSFLSPGLCLTSLSSPYLSRVACCCSLGASVI